MNTSVAEVRLGDGETVKGTYPITRIRRPLGWIEAYLVITDARVIYRAQASNTFNSSVSNREIRIADVAGLSISARRGLSPLSGASLAVAALFALIFLFIFPPLVLIPLAISALIVFLGRRAIVSLIITSSQTSEIGASGGALVGVIHVGSGFKAGAAGFLMSVYALLMSPLMMLLALLGVLDAHSGTFSGLDVTGENRRALDEAVQMYDEIGALILDIQNRGVLANDGTRRGA